MSETVLNVYWDWMAVRRRLPPEAVKDRLIKIGFEYDESIDAYVIPRKMSSESFRNKCYAIGVDTKAIEGTCETQEVVKNAR